MFKGLRVATKKPWITIDLEITEGKAGISLREYMTPSEVAQSLRQLAHLVEVKGRQVSSKTNSEPHP